MNKRDKQNIKITDLKDMLIKTEKIYASNPAYKIKEENETYKIITHKEIRQMVNYLGTSLINMGLKEKRIAVIGENRYEWELAYLSIVCGTGIVVPLDKSLPENELENLIKRSKVFQISSPRLAAQGLLLSGVAPRWMSPVCINRIVPPEFFTNFKYNIKNFSRKDKEKSQNTLF